MKHKRVMNAFRVRAKLEHVLVEIKELNPSSEEIEEYGKDAGYGTVTYTNDEGYFPPHLHDTWGKKWGGRVHIDIGSGGCHLMLDKNTAPFFIDFIRAKRANLK